MRFHKKLSIFVAVGTKFCLKISPGAGDTPVTESESVSESSGREETERRVD